MWKKTENFICKINSKDFNNTKDDDDLATAGSKTFYS